MANGYIGKILWVDLSKGIVEEEAVDEAYAGNTLAVTAWGSRYSSIVKGRRRSAGPGQHTRLPNGSSSPGPARWAGRDSRSWGSPP